MGFREFDSCDTHPVQWTLSGFVYPEGIWYRGATPEMGREMVRAHLMEGKLLQSPRITRIGFIRQRIVL